MKHVKTTYKDFLKENKEFWWISDDRVKNLLKDFRQRKEVSDGIYRDNDPYGEEQWGDEDPNNDINIKKRIKEVVNYFEDKWKNSAPGKAKEFIENYPRKIDFDDVAVDDQYEDEDEPDHEVSSEDEVYTLSQMGIYMGNKIGERDSSGYGIVNVTTDDWCDFSNTLMEAGW